MATGLCWTLLSWAEDDAGEPVLWFHIQERISKYREAADISIGITANDKMEREGRNTEKTTTALKEERTGHRLDGSPIVTGYSHKANNVTFPLYCKLHGHVLLLGRIVPSVNSRSPQAQRNFTLINQAYVLAHCHP